MDELIAAEQQRRLLILLGLISEPEVCRISIHAKPCRVCKEVSHVVAGLLNGRGDMIRWRCRCGQRRQHKLPRSWPMPALGSDCSDETARKFFAHDDAMRRMGRPDPGEVLITYAKWGLVVSGLQIYSHEIIKTSEFRRQWTDAQGLNIRKAYLADVADGKLAQVLELPKDRDSQFAELFKRDRSDNVPADWMLEATHG